MYDLLSRYQLISYGNNVVNNILTKISLNKVANESASVFYPYVIKEGERPDIIAADYYGDPRYAWLILLTNKVVDPIYDWPLSQRQFEKFIIKKYSSIEYAQQKIFYWRNNWYLDDSLITVSAYEALSPALRKYWDPVLGRSSNSVNYRRKQSDSTAETNVTSEIEVDDSTGFQVGEVIRQFTGSSVTGLAVIKGINDNTLVVQNVIGTIDTSDTVIGYLSQTVATVSAYTVISQDIPLDEVPYWTYVTSYDYEEDLNESKKHIRLIDRAYLNVIEKQLDNIL